MSSFLNSLVEEVWPLAMRDTVFVDIPTTSSFSLSSLSLSASRLSELGSLKSLRV